MNKQKQLYKKMCKKYNKELVSLAKKTSPYDHGCLLEYIYQNLKYMYEYYLLDYNVWGEDKEQSRLISLKQAIDEYDAWQTCKDKYFIHHETGGKENKKGICILQDDETKEYSDWWIEYSKGTYKETADAFNKEYIEHRKKFFKILSDNIENWWD